MAGSEQRKFNDHIKKVFKWAMIKMFDEYPTAVSSPYDLKQILQTAWDECVEDGEIQLLGNEKSREVSDN